MTQQSGSSGLAIGTAAGGILGGTLPNPTYAGGSSYPTLATVFATLGAAITNHAASGLFDVLTVALVAGTWLCAGQINFGNTAAGNNGCNAGLYDGTNDLVMGYSAVPQNCYVVIPASILYVAAGPVTLHLRAKVDNATNVILSAGGIGSPANLATQLYAVRIA